MLPGNLFTAYLVAHQQAMDRLREADKYRLVRIALRGRGQGRLYPRVLAWLGSRLVAWGQRLQTRYGAAVKLEAEPRG